MAQPQQPGEELRPDQAFNVLFLALAGHATCFWPFTRRDFGVEAMSFNGVAAMVEMACFFAFAPCEEMGGFFAVWLGLVVFHRLDGFIRRRGGWDQHSRYDGWPWLAMVVFRHKPTEFQAKAVCEPVMCLLCGALLAPWSPPLGLFVAAGAVSLLLKVSIEDGIERTRVRAWRDREFEMRERFERYRHRR